MAKKSDKESWEKKAPEPSVQLPPPKPQPGLLVKTPPPELDKVTDEDLERVLLAIALFDPRRLYREDGTPIYITELDDVTALALAGLDVEENFDYDAESKARINVGVTKKFKLADRQRAIETLLRMRGKLKDTVRVTHVDELVTRLQAGRKRTEKK